VGEEVAVADHRRGTADRFVGDRARRANDVVAVQRERQVLLGELLDGEVHGGRLLLDHAVIERALAGLALVVLQHIGLEGELQLGDVAGRAHFDGKARGVALAEEDAALKTGVGAHCLGSLRWREFGLDGEAGSVPRGRSAPVGDAVRDQPVGRWRVDLDPVTDAIRLARMGVRACQNEWVMGHPWVERSLASVR
jgi:hypothetical protein